jgi:DNA transposition AAA+ family ATPase
MALDARYLKRHQRALGGLYQSVLRTELTRRYDIAWGAIENGQAEIGGIPRELLEAFSKRTAQVDAALADKVGGFREREGRDPSRWERAALTREAAEDTRVAKTHTSSADLAAVWRTEAAALGWTRERVVAGTRAAALTPAVAKGVTFPDVIELCSTKGSSWTRADVLQAICDLAPPVSRLSGPEWATAIERACDRVIAGCVNVDPPEGRGPVRASDGRSVWLAPTEPHLTHEGVLAQEERIVLFAAEAHDAPARPSATVEREGLDVLQADAAAAVAGHDGLVLVVGPAGTGKTTALRHAVADLARQGRPVFGVAPTAKAAKVLRDETAMPADTVAKLLHEWRTGAPHDAYRLPARSTLVVDEAGMVGTGALADLVHLAVSQQWRLVLVGDPRQLQAVGRGGMFAELCRTGRTHELATIHRFRHRWEQAASLQLRAANPDALDAYIRHGRVTAGTVDGLVAEAARGWLAHTAAGQHVAVVAETNDHVDALNRAIQRQRRVHGQLGARAVHVAGGETAAVGDIVATRRNDRTLRTDRGEPVRNRDLWTVVDVRRDGGLTVSHHNGHGQATLPADYVRAHVRLGYAATCHGYEGDTVDVSLGVVTSVTSHRGLYVAATRGREQNQLLVVADDPELARDVLEQVLTNDRADIPAIAQRRHLAAQIPRPSAPAIWPTRTRSGCHGRQASARRRTPARRTAPAPACRHRGRPRSGRDRAASQPSGPGRRTALAAPRPERACRARR